MNPRGSKARGRFVGFLNLVSHVRVMLGARLFSRTYAPSNSPKVNKKHSRFIATHEEECQSIDFFDAIAESVLKKHKPYRETGGAFLLGRCANSVNDTDYPGRRTRCCGHIRPPSGSSGVTYRAVPIL